MKFELSQPIITTASGQLITVPFKQYDYTKKLSLSTSNIFEYLQTEEVTIPSDAKDISFAVNITASVPDTMKNGKLNLDKKTAFTGITAELFVKDKAASIRSSGTTVLGNEKWIHKFSKSFTIPAGDLAGKKITLMPNVKLTGKFNENDLTFSLVNISIEGGSSGSPQPQPLLTEGLPANVNLGQNYPNPFNPTTTISHALPNEGITTLKVYDMLGREVATLVNEYKNAGSYNVTFDASKLSSGIYIYKLMSGNFTSVKKMQLIK